MLFYYRARDEDQKKFLIVYCTSYKKNARFAFFYIFYCNYYGGIIYLLYYTKYC